MIENVGSKAWRITPGSEGIWTEVSARVVGSGLLLIVIWGSMKVY